MKPYIASQTYSSVYEVKHDDVCCNFNNKSTRQYSKDLIVEGILEHRENTCEDFEEQPKWISRKEKRKRRNRILCQKFKKKFAERKKFNTFVS